ncbi:ArnT family glycosyltransferase [Lichenihabitans psoromatis]|uniref:ArnT family glycosyltransferase n=1 Tax=Lichenihabitans psoromatis TaxID=2528642 RepID=UPI001FE17AD2|nr:glycosyltransferase family 39 protein [Lichenihabitans psoromatis]
MFDGLLDRVSRHHALACALLILVGLTAYLPGFAGLFPMDRDEPRFAQASKQMLESGDYVAIRFQDEARNKKPVGIYWMQAGAVSVAERLGVADARTSIWVYRIPSLLGALAAVLLTYWTALALTQRRTAVLAGLLMAPCVILVVEAHLAKTDAVLLATVVAAMGALARAWMRRTENRPLELWLCTVFWTAIGIGILIKGPITPMVVIFAVIALSLRHRSARWLANLRPWAGLVWCLLIVLPWFVLIVKASGGAFFSEAVGHDMLAKVGSGQESHGAPLGTYLVALWVTGWPMAPFLLLAAPIVWKQRWSDSVFFLLAWVVPAWILFETVPTKLPHYVMPMYPALAILSAMGATWLRQVDRIGRVRLAVFGLAALLLPIALPVALVAAKGRVASTIDPATIVVAALAFVAAVAVSILAIQRVRRGDIRSAILCSVVAALIVNGFILGWFMNQTHADLIGLSPRLADAGRAAIAARPGCGAPLYATVGDREPSLVFLTDTRLLMTDGAGAAAFMKAGPCRVAFVDQPGEAAFLSALGTAPEVSLASRAAGLNINGGKKLDIGVYVRQDGSP